MSKELELVVGRLQTETDDVTVLDWVAVGVKDVVARSVEVGAMDEVRTTLVVKVFDVVIAGLLWTSVTRLRPRRIKVERLVVVRILIGME
jgi:hypothetical protein